MTEWIWTTKWLLLNNYNRQDPDSERDRERGGEERKAKDKWAACMVYRGSLIHMVGWLGLGKAKKRSERSLTPPPNQATRDPGNQPAPNDLTTKRLAKDVPFPILWTSPPPPPPPILQCTALPPAFIFAEVMVFLNLQFYWAGRFLIYNMYFLVLVFTV